MKQIILGTAGHIDHGKTSLIKALTGVNTDRLKEEQVRGITIELGFACLALPNGRTIGIVDVPGHEKFIKNMVAGATGIDIVALVVAADEGIMPQTREHMEICSLLDIRHGVVVVTKTDMVDEEWLELVKEEISDFTRGTFLEQAAVIPVSSTTGDGLADFISALDDLSLRITARADSGLFRLPVDRVFTMQGFGTVITGTLTSGKVGKGERIMLYPSGVTSKVRGLQVHNHSVATASAGMRTAINFQGLDRSSVSRGDVVTLPDTLTPSYMVDGTLHYLAGNRKSMRNRTRVRFHSGTSEVMGIVVLLDGEKLEPGESGLAQIRLKTPVTLIKDDRYVLRSYSPARTIGGGRIIVPIAAKHKPNKPELLDYLNAVAGDDPLVGLQSHIREAGYSGCSRKDLKIMTNQADKRLDQALQAMMSQRIIFQIDKERPTFIHRVTFDAIGDHAIVRIEDYHRKFSLKPGIPKEELKSSLPMGIGAKAFGIVLRHLLKTERVRQAEEIISLAGHKVALALDQQTLRRQILAAYRDGGLTPPYFKDIRRDLAAPLEQAAPVLDLLAAEGAVVKIKEDLYYYRPHLEALKKKLTDYLLANSQISTPQFKLMAGASRKFVIPLIEYFDTIQLTIRIGDIRQLRRQPGK